MSKRIHVENGHFDDDGFLHISGIDVIASTTRRDWKGADINKRPDDEGEKPLRGRTTCPHCASPCIADAASCWNCGAALA